MDAIPGTETADTIIGTNPNTGSLQRADNLGSRHQHATCPHPPHMSEEGISTSHSGAAGSSASHHPTDWYCSAKCWHHQLDDLIYLIILAISLLQARSGD